MTTPELERRIRNWFADEVGDTEPAPRSAYAFLDALPQSVPGDRRLLDRRTIVLLAAAALLVGLLAGAVAIGSGLVKLPANLPPPRPTPLANEYGGPDVFYRAFPEFAGGIWVANGDGTGAHEFLPDGDRVLAVSADGSQIVLAREGADSVDVATVIGREPRLANIRRVSLTGGLSFSPDGTRLAFVGTAQGSGQSRGSSVVSIMDVATGGVVELGSTAVHGAEGSNVAPQWSPDGRRLVFGRRAIGSPTPGEPWFDSAIYVVDADGSDLRQLVPTELFPEGALWSPDGSRILFTSRVEWLGLDDQGNRENSNVESDVYSIRPDGSDLRRLTTDTLPRVDHRVPVEWGATAVSWTREGRIIFTRVPLGDTSEGSPPRQPTELWVMDADGGRQQQLDRTDLAELTAAGCVVCPYPLQYETYWPGVPIAYWRPAS